MDKFLRRFAAAVGVLAVLFLFLSLAGHIHIADARLTGVNPVGTSADEFCVGKVNFEICVDYLGDILPTKSATQTLGTAALPFSNVFSVSAVTTGSELTGTAGTSSYAAAGVAATNHSVIGLFSTPSVTLGSSGQNTGINVSTVIPVNSSYELIISSSGNIVMTSTPNISTTTLVGGTIGIPDGTYLVIGSTDTHTITFQSNGTLSGSQLKLGAASRVVTQYKDLTLRFSSADSFWHEVAYSSDAN